MIPLLFAWLMSGLGIFVIILGVALVWSMLGGDDQRCGHGRRACGTCDQHR